MEGATNFVQNTQDFIPEEAQPTDQPVELSREEQIESLTQLLQNLFEPNNIVNNLYLLQKAQNHNFEIPIKFVYMERSVKAITTDRDTINEALDNASNVIVLKKDGYVTAIKPRQNEPLRKVDVKNIPFEKKDSFKTFVYSFEDIQDSIINWKFNAQIKITSIICKDEASASLLHQKLTTTKFDEDFVDCSLSTESLYISAIENQNRKSRAYPNSLPMNPIYGMNPQMNPAFGYNPYAGFNPYQMGSYYGMPQNNFYVTNNYSSMNHFYNNPNGAQNFSKTGGYNGNANGYKKPYNPNYKNDKKPQFKRGGAKQPRDKNFKYGSKQPSTKSSSIEVNETEFPPL